ncbi:hypothetical protein N2603_43355 [Bradyrhizobium huanghuaihaiense]|uniref:hypothetical protein n=1 Tax=Bradyrhizobium huanghuaihaiense TaxID=990078 RepID=UPI0021A97A60|nr:hypothetical protein [Bradyrhizobium sp. CB3035]UWU76625.1 hypothetical protein N2603_43355 [Bradyrhizobium sp. CB3035]
MGRLDIRLDKKNLGTDLELGVVADVLQIKDFQGKFPEAPFEQEVVIPAGATGFRRVDVPPGTYRIEARLPSGEVMSKTQEVSDNAAEVPVVFEPAASPHEWLSWQRLAGNVPSEKEYEEFLKDIAGKISKAAKSKDVRIDISPTVIGWAAGHLRQLHVRVKALLEGASAAPAAGDDPAEANATAEPTTADFELLQANPSDGTALWSTLRSHAAWTEWRKSASPYPGCSFVRKDDRALSLWQVTQSDYQKSIVGTPRGALPLRCLAAMRRGDGVDVILLPIPWAFEPDPDKTPVTIEVLREAGASAAGRTTVVVQDPSLGGLLMYLNSNKIGSASTVLAEASQTGLINSLLADKRNPLAACAAGYVAIAGLADSNREQWTQWLGLLSQFAWLPDGNVIQAAYLLKTARSKSELDEALTSLKKAYGKGIPFFIAGVQHLQQGLYSFSEKDAEARQMYESVTNVALKVDANQVFTLLRLPSEQN